MKVSGTDKHGTPYGVLRVMFTFQLFEMEQAGALVIARGDKLSRRTLQRTLDDMFWCYGMDAFTEDHVAVDICITEENLHDARDWIAKNYPEFTIREGDNNVG